MLRSLKEIESYGVRATDGEAGRVHDFYFDDKLWEVRYLVIGKSRLFRARREVLATPEHFRGIDAHRRDFNLDLTRRGVEECPSSSTDKPVSRQFDREYYQFYDWPYWGNAGDLEDRESDDSRVVNSTSGSRGSDPHLRSVREVTGYLIQGTDGTVGHVKDFVVDDEIWCIDHLVVDTSNWWLGKTVTLTPYWVERISWAENTLYVNLTRAAIRSGATPPSEPAFSEVGPRSHWRVAPKHQNRAAPDDLSLVKDRYAARDR
jgi:sporulation protein YlmC with PRC-barrel domain